MFGAKLCVHYWEVVPCSEGPLSEVPLYCEMIWLEGSHNVMLIGMARGISEGASKKNLVVFLFGDVLGHSFFFFKHAMFLLQLASLYAFW